MYFHGPSQALDLQGSTPLKIRGSPHLPEMPQGQTGEVVSQLCSAETVSEKGGICMSQIVAVKTRTGVILAADGKALDIDSSGQLVEMEANRLI